MGRPVAGYIVPLVAVAILVTSCDSSDPQANAEFLDGTTWETSFNAVENQTVYSLGIFFTLEATGSDVVGAGTCKGTAYLEAGTLPVDLSVRLEGSVVQKAITFEMALSPGDPPLMKFSFSGEISADGQRLVGTLTPGDLSPVEVVFVRECGCR